MGHKRFHDGRVHGARPARTGKGDALRFNGQQDYLAVPDSPNLHFQRFTYELWVKASATSVPLPLMSKAVANNYRDGIISSAGGSNFYAMVPRSRTATRPAPKATPFC